MRKFKKCLKKVGAFAMAMAIAVSGLTISSVKEVKAATSYYVITATGNTNVFNASGADIGNASQGNILTVTGTANVKINGTTFECYKISKIGTTSKSGYIKKARATMQVTNYQTFSKKIYMHNDRVLRALPKTDSTALNSTSYNRGAIATVSGSVKNTNGYTWYICGNGFIMKDGGTYDLSVKSEKRSAIVDYAKKFAGKLHYTQGTTGYVGKRYLGSDLDSIVMSKVGTTWGVDCSSYVASVYLHFGMTIPTNTTGYGTANRRANIANVAVGDIVWRSGHVEMYIGNGQTIGAHSCYGGNHTGDVSVVTYNSNSYTYAYNFVG